MGNRWIGEEGNLFLSILLREVRQWTWVPLLVAVSTRQTLQNWGPDLAIKWPNDLMYEGGKCGGILCEGVGGQKNSFVVAGLGLNLIGAPQLKERHTSSLRAFEIQREQIAPLIVECVLQNVEKLNAEGERFLVQDYQEHSYLKPGDEIQWKTTNEIHRGFVVGLGTSGELQVETTQGLKSLFSEEVSRVLAVESPKGG